MSLIPCQRCGKSYPIRTLQMDSGGKGLICQSCFEVITKVHAQTDKIHREKLERMKNLVVTRKEQFKGGHQYGCRRCKYKFVSMDPKIKKCPYCSEEGYLYRMDEAIKEVDDILSGRALIE